MNYKNSSRKMENSYTIREIDVHFSDIKQTLERIEDQTTKTNGRVSSLEIWRGYVLGACAAILILVPLLYNFINVRIDTLENDHKNTRLLLKEINETTSTSK